MTVLTIDQALTRAKSHRERGEVEDARHLLEAVLEAFPNHSEARKDLEGVKALLRCGDNLNPPQEVIDRVLSIYNSGQLLSAFEEAKVLTTDYPGAFVIWNIMGAAAAQLEMLDEAINAFEKVISLKPDYADGYNNLGNALKMQGKSNEAIKAFNQAIEINPEYVDPLYNLGIVFKDQDRLDEAVKLFNRVIRLKPDYAKAYNNMGLALLEQGKPLEALAKYNKALECNPAYAEAYHNKGLIFENEGKLDQALKAYKKAIECRPDYAECYYHIGQLIKYTANDESIDEVKALYEDINTSKENKCRLSFALFKIHEDLSEIDLAFHYLCEGNRLRKDLLGYNYKHDVDLFSKVRNIQPCLKKISRSNTKIKEAVTPIFILGMPRSGTTLVEQIISSHSYVYGAGELMYLSKFGKKIATGEREVNRENLETFRSAYLNQLAQRSYGKSFVTDKLPHNFLFVPLICAAFPEAKIIHVKRDPAATCWSNYRHNFAGKGLGYAYDLNDCVAYYKLYEDLMQTWELVYDQQIYSLEYEKLIADQESETRLLIQNLGIGWEDACLNPHENTRSVRTASNTQIRKKVYKGSSQAWRKYEPYLNNVFQCFNV